MEEVKVNADRNEMIALLQHAKGARFVQVHMQHSRLDNRESTQAAVAPRLTYKYIPQYVGKLNEGDYVIVQYAHRLGIGVVDKVLTEAPTSDEYDYNKSLRHVVQRIDVEKSAQLSALDRKMLKTITQSEANDRMERLTRQLGIALDKVTLELPAIE